VEGHYAGWFLDCQVQWRGVVFGPNRQKSALAIGGVLGLR